MENKWCPLCGGVGHYFSDVVLRDVPCVCHIPQRPIAPQNEFSIIDKNLKEIAKQLDGQRLITPEPENDRYCPACGWNHIESKNEIHNVAVEECVKKIPLEKFIKDAPIELSSDEAFAWACGFNYCRDLAIAALEALKK